MKYEGDDQFTSVMVNLDRVESDSKWYEFVIRANINRNAVFLRMGRRYSPISNIIIPPFKGVKFAMRGSDLEYAEQGDNADFVDYQSDQEVEAEFAEDVVSEEADEADGDGDYDDDDDFGDYDYVGPVNQYSSSNDPAPVQEALKSAMTRLPRSAVPPEKEVTINPIVEERFLVLENSLLGAIVPNENTSSTSTTMTLSMSSHLLPSSAIGSPPPPPPPRVSSVSPVPSGVAEVNGSDVEDEPVVKSGSPPPEERRAVRPRATKGEKKVMPKKKNAGGGLFTDATVEGDLGTFAADEFKD